MKYILFDESGVLLARYVSGVHQDIPKEAITVTDKLFIQTVNEQDGIWKLASETGEIAKHPYPNAPLVVPQLVSRAQGKAALVQSGLWSDILVYIESITDPTEKALAEIALNDTQEWRRDSPTLTAIAAALSLSGEQMDQLFLEASQILL